MRDILRTARQVMPDFLESADIWLVEISETLQSFQAKALSDEPVHWVKDIDKLPADGPLLVIGNEFLDCMPIRQFKHDGTGWKERAVDVSDGAFTWTLIEPDTPLELLDPGLPQEAPEGAIREVSPAAHEFIRALTERLAGQGGAALFVDYGPMNPGFGDTLQALRHHDRVDPLDIPGDADLSAHVDFGALSQVVHSAGGYPAGPVPQGVFLNTLGAGERLQRLIQANPDSAREVLAGYARITQAEGMGTLFKAWAIKADPALELPAFPR
jgi:SAM-dependent MidA family methyltransferase